MAAKTKGNKAETVKTCLVKSRTAFRTKAPAGLSVTIAGIPLTAGRKEFAPGPGHQGSLGWFANGKVDVEIDGQLVPCQVGLNIIVPHSKELPAE